MNRLAVCTWRDGDDFDLIDLSDLPDDAEWPLQCAIRVELRGGTRLMLFFERHRPLIERSRLPDTEGPCPDLMQYRFRAAETEEGQPVG